MDDDVRMRFEDLEKRVAKLEAILETAPVMPKKGTSVGEFIASRKPKGDVQKTLVVGYYLEKHQSLSSFNITDLEDGFRQAKEPLPSNINDSVYKNIRKGHMMETKEKKDGLKAWNLTGTGERFVENDLKGE